MSQATRILGCNPLTAHCVNSCFSFNPNSVFEQSLRWKRKPQWLGTAKSKIFRVPKRPVLPEEEMDEIKRLSNNYRTVVKSIRLYLIKLVEDNKVETDPELIEKAKQEDFVTSSVINDEWNKKISLEREERLAEERALRLEKITRAIEKKKLIKEQKLIEAVEEIRKAEELIPTLITNDNIDEAIEKALANVVDHNFAIDMDGNRYTGDITSQSKASNEKKVQASQ